MRVNHNLSRFIRFDNITKGAAVGCQTDLHKYSVQVDHPFRFCLTVFYTKAGYFITVTDHF